MKEFFYKRMSKGFQVVTQHSSMISPDVNLASRRVVEAKEGALSTLSYRQSFLDDGTVVLSCGYNDPHGERGSSMTHVLLTQSGEERAALLAAYPIMSRYFDQFRERYDADAESVDLNIKSIALEDYLDRRTAQPSDALTLLRDTFKDEDTLAQLFTAAIDSAAANNRITIVILPGQSPEDVAMPGKRLGEAILACLPDVVAASLGIMSPAMDIKDVSYGLRFTHVPAMATVKSAYRFVPAEDRVLLPGNVRLESSACARALAKLVMAGDLQRLRALREALTDWTLFREEGLYDGIELRYAFFEAQSQMAPERRRKLLDWHHAMIERAQKANDASILDVSSFWAPVEKWIREAYLPETWANMGLWKRGDPLLDPALIKRLFEDGQKLYALGRPEAVGYRDFLAERMREGNICPESEMKTFRRETLGYFHDQVTHAKTADFERDQLYWRPVEDWVRGEWAKGALMGDGKLVACVKRLYELAPEGRGDYVDGYVGYLTTARSVTLSTGDSSALYAAATDEIVRDHRDFFSNAMRRELEAVNPFNDPAARARYEWYLRRCEDDPAMRESLRGIAQRQLSGALNGCGKEDVPALLEELNGGAGKGYLAVAERLTDRADASGQIAARVCAIHQSDGFYSYYFKDRQTARQLAALMDEHSGAGYGRKNWQGIFGNLESVRGMTGDRLNREAFESYVTIADRADERQLALMRQLLDENLGDAFGERVPEDLKGLAYGLAMRAYDRSGIALHEAIGALGKLSVSESKLKGWCAKHADTDAVEGTGYLASVLLDYLKVNPRKREDAVVPYPGQYDDDDDEAPARVIRRGHRGGLAGLPAWVPALGGVFGAGFIASATALLKLIGLI